MTRKKSLLAGVGMMAILTVASKLVRIIVLMVTARYLTPEDFGIVAAFSMVLAFAYLFAEMGLVKTLIQRPVINKTHIGGAIIISTTFSIMVFFTLIFASDYIESLTSITGVGRPLQISALLFVLLGLSNICSALFQRNGDIVFIGKVQAFGTIFGNICITVPLLWFDIGYWAIIIGIFVTELISLTVIIWQGKSFLKLSFAKKETYEIIKYSSAFLSHNIMGTISRQIDIALVGRYLGKADLGNYSRSMQLIEFPSQIYFLVVDRVVFPTMSAMRTDKKKLKQFFIDIYSLLLLALSVGAIVLFFGATEIIKVLMGEGWDIVIVLIEILAVSVVFKCLTGFVNSFLAAYGKIKALTYLNLLSLIIFSVSIFIGLDFGITGIAYAVVCSSALRFFMSVVITVFYVHISVKTFILGSIPALSTLTFLTLIYSGISLMINIPDLVSILVAVMLWGLFCYCCPSAVLLSENGKNFISKIKYKRNKPQCMD